MRLFPAGQEQDVLLLDCSPLSATTVRRNVRFKIKCRRYDSGDGPNGTIVIRRPRNQVEFKATVDALRLAIELMGEILDVNPKLEAHYLAIGELAEEHYRLGNEVKRHDSKHLAHFNEFSEVVNSTMIRPLKERQMWDSFFMATMKRAGNFSVPGSGKTATVLGAYAFLAEREIVRRIMVVCPRNAFDSWQTEWRLCFGEKRPLNFFSTQDDAYRRLNQEAKRGLIRSGIGDANLILVNYEASSPISHELADIASKKTLLVFDEVHRVKRVNGIWARAALEIARHATITFALTGTPLPNTYLDLHNFLHILYPVEYDSFFGWDTGELKNADEHEQMEINRRIQPFYCRTTKRDLGVPPADKPREIIVKAGRESTELLRVLREQYKKNPLALMFRIMQLESNPQSLLNELDPRALGWVFEDIDEPNLTQSLTMQSGGEVSYSDEIRQLVDSIDATEKRTSCIELVASLVAQKRSVIIWTIFRDTMRMLRSDFHALGIDSRIIDGSVSQDERTVILSEFRGESFPVLITNPHTLAESVSLHMVCHDAVYFEYSFNLVHLLQSQDRIHRLGLPEGQRTRYYFLEQHYSLGFADYSMGEKIYLRLREKEQTMLDAIDMGLIETEPTTEEDLDVIFDGLFEK